jgi:hypothetical protein
MVNINNKLIEIKKLIDNENYFVINKPRQYGKTTTINELEKLLCKKYLVISISFEGIGDLIFEDEKLFSKGVLELMSDNLEFTDEKIAKKLKSLSLNALDLKGLSKAISKFTKESNKEVILLSEEKRLDVVVTYNSFKYIVELKIWRGEEYHKNGLNQLSDYLEINNITKGYLVIFNFNKNKKYTEELIKVNNNDIFIVYV